ncbi:MAG: PCRF domain-containing protein, partial [Halothiobacillaceae bacterium]|nr:PCRF domain-containing protein [Halothiobacillaceae bacterium]
MLPPALFNRLFALSERYEELTALLSELEVINDQTRFRTLSKEHARLHDLVEVLARYQKAKQALDAALVMSKEADREMAELAEEEIPELRDQIEVLDEALKLHLLPHDPADEGDIILEVRAGTGGDEAALFAGDLLRMYLRYADARGWRSEILSAQEGEHGGYREAIAQISGDGVFAALKFESGAHRVQRVPATETQGRVHTSAATVAVMPVVPEAEAVTLDP